MARKKKSDVDKFKDLNKVIEVLPEEKSISKAIARTKGYQGGDTDKAIMNLPTDTAFQLACREAGITEEYVAMKLKESIEASICKLDDKKGILHEFPDHKVRLKAIELWASISGIKTGTNKGKEGDKHIHLHGLTDEELDAKLRAAKIGEDS